MRTYIIRRVLLLIPTFFLVTILVFLSVRFIPGDAVDLLMFRMAEWSGGTADNAAQLRACSTHAGWEASCCMAISASPCCSREP